MSKTDREIVVDRIVAAVHTHANATDEDENMVGDLLGLLYEAIDTMDDETFSKFTESSTVSDILEWEGMDEAIDDQEDIVTLSDDADVAEAALTDDAEDD